MTITITWDGIARLAELPQTWPQAICRSVVITALLFSIVILDNYFQSAAPAGMFGYLWGSLSMYGFMRRHLR